MQNKYETEVEIYPINNSSHLENHLNYLLRTDVGQKWTNDLTNGNIYIFRTLTGELKFAITESKKGRETLKRGIIERIKIEAENEGQFLIDFTKTLKQIRSVYTDVNTKGFTEEVQKDTLDLIRMIQTTYPNFKLICGAVHTDQPEDGLHVHFLYFEEKKGA